MSIIGTCGHGLKDLGISIYVKDSDKEGNKAVSYMTVCDKCYEWWKDSGELFNSGEEAYDWLKTEDY